MIFKTIETGDDIKVVTALRARKIAQEELNVSIAKQQVILETDTVALSKLETQVASGIPYEEAYAQSMTKASIAAKEHAIATQGASGSTDVFVAKQKQAQAQLKATETASKGASVAMKALSIAGNMIIMWAISEAINLAVKGLDTLIVTANEAKDSAENAINTYQDAQNTLQSNNQTIQDISDDYKKLANGVDDFGNNISLSADEYSKYNEIVNQIADMFPQMVQGYTDEGNAIITLKGNVEELTKAYEASTIAARQNFIATGDDIIKNIKNTETLSDYEEIFEKLQNLDNEKGIRELAKYFNENIDKYGQKSGLVVDIEKILKDNGIEIRFEGHNADLFFSDEDVEYYLQDNIQSRLQSAIKNITLELQGNESLSKSQGYSLLDAMLEDNYTFSTTLPESMQNYIKSIAREFDHEFYAQFSDKEEMFDYVLNNLILPVSNNEKFSEALTVGFNLKTQFNNNEITVGEYQEKLSAFLQTISTLPEDSQKAIKLIFGIETNEDGTTTSDTDVMINNVKNKLQDQFDDKVVELSLGDLQIASEKLEIDPSIPISWDELIKKIEEYKNALDEKDNKNDVSLDAYKKASEGISSLATAFKELTDSEYVSLETISKIKEAVGDSVSNWDEYEQKLLSVKKGTAEYNQLMRELTYATLEKQLGGVKALASADEKYVAQLLKENGVLNANEVAHNAVERAKAKELAQSNASNQESVKTIESLIQEAKSAGISTNAYLELTAKEILFNNNTLNTSQKCQQILAIASAAGVASTAYSTLTNQINAWASKDLIGSGTRTDTATKLGMTVKSEKERVKEDKKAKGKGNLYIASDGKEFEEYKDAMYYQESLNNVQKISDAYSNTNFVLPDYSGAKTTSKDTKETFDWIETKISRLQRSITNFGKTVSATWKSWTDRNSALKSQISAVTSEINLQQQAADKYWALAESVSGVGNYKKLIQNGALDISTVRDENTINAIKQYQEYYENYLSALDAKQDAEDELRNLKQTSADNISTEYDDLMSFIEHEKSMLDSTANILESKGYMASASIYDKLIQYEYDTISKLEEKYKKLNENLNNSGIQQGTEQWNDMKLEILEVEEAILESKNALVEYNNTLQELDWEVFDKLQEKISGITEEADFLIKLMSDEKMFDEGKITEHGQATLGLYVLNYKTYLAQAEEYGQKLEEIREDLENDPYNQTLVDQEKEWTEALRDSILASEDALQSIVDLKQEGYDSLLESLDTAIEKYKDLINEQKNAYDYQKQIDNLTGDVTKYQKIMKSLEGMGDTEEGKKMIQEYSVKLRDSEEALAEAENEKYLDDLDKLLQNLSDDTTEFVSQKMDNVDALVKEVIAQTETNTSSILDTLKTETSNVNTTLTSEMEKVWGANGTFTTSLNSVVDMFEQYFDNLQKEADTKAKEVVSSTPSGGSSSGSTPPVTSAPAPSSSSSSSSSSSWGSWFINKKDSYPKSKLKVDSSIVDRLKSHDFDSSFTARAQYYRAMGGSGNYVGSSNQNRFMINSMKSHGFTKGGTIGNLIKATGEDGFVLARTGEGILTPENMKMLENVMITMNPIVDSLAKLPSLPDMRKQNGDMQVTFGDIQMYGVNDPVEFEKQLLHHMKNSHPIRKVMKDTTIGEALGKNPMIRYTR